MLRIDRLLARESLRYNDRFPKDRRNSPRKSVALSIELQVMEQSGAAHIYRGTTIDASLKGLLCGMPEAVPVPGRVMVIFQEIALPDEQRLALPGEVARCLASPCQVGDWDTPVLPFEVAVVLDDSASQAFRLWAEWLQNKR